MFDVFSHDPVGGREEKVSFEGDGESGGHLEETFDSGGGGMALLDCFDVIEGEEEEGLETSG